MRIKTKVLHNRANTFLVMNVNLKTGPFLAFTAIFSSFRSRAIAVVECFKMNRWLGSNRGSLPLEATTLSLGRIYRPAYGGAGFGMFTFCLFYALIVSSTGPFRTIL